MTDWTQRIEELLSRVDWVADSEGDETPIPELPTADEVKHLMAEYAIERLEELKDAWNKKYEPGVFICGDGPHQETELCRIDEARHTAWFWATKNLGEEIETMQRSLKERLAKGQDK
jgi:hypothetical protein